MTGLGNRDSAPWPWRGGQVNHYHHGEVPLVATLPIVNPIECNMMLLAAEKWWWSPAFQTC